jgi:hypothetical protein
MILPINVVFSIGVACVFGGALGYMLGKRIGTYYNAKLMCKDTFGAVGLVAGIVVGTAIGYSFPLRIE